MRKSYLPRRSKLRMPKRKVRKLRPSWRRLRSSDRRSSTQFLKRPREPLKDSARLRNKAAPGPRQQPGEGAIHRPRLGGLCTLPVHSRTELVQCVLSITSAGMTCLVSCRHSSGGARGTLPSYDCSPSHCSARKAACAPACASHHRTILGDTGHNEGWR